MTKRNAAYIPDVFWTKFRIGEITHFDYFPKTEEAIAYFADGNQWRFSTVVTQEHIDDDHRAWLEELRASGAHVYEFDLKADAPKYHSQLKNIT